MASRNGAPPSAQPRQSANRPSGPDLVLLNGKLFAADPACAYAQAVAIGAKRILAVGTSKEIAAMADAHTRHIDPAGRLVIPGINDADFHHTPDPRA